MVIKKTAGLKLGAMFCTSLLCEYISPGSGVSTALAGTALSGFGEVFGGFLSNISTAAFSKESFKILDDYSDKKSTYYKAQVEAVENVLKQVRQKFESEEKYHLSIPQKALRILGDDSKDVRDARRRVLKEMLDEIYEVFQDEEYSKELFKSNQFTTPEKMIASILKDKKPAAKEFQEGQADEVYEEVAKAFKQSFKETLIDELKNSKKATIAFQEQLLSSILKNTNEQGEKLDQLLKYAHYHNLDFIDVKARLSESIEEQKQIAQSIKDEIAQLYGVSLTVYRDRNDEADETNKFKFSNLNTRFYGREAELNYLFNFLEAEPEKKFQWTMISGEGGAGKSRLANEFCVRAHDKLGWLSGFFDVVELDHFKWSNYDFKNDTLIVFDYVERNRKEILGKLKLLNKRKDKLKKKVRILLLDRTFQDEFASDIRTELSDWQKSYYTTNSSHEIKPFHISQMDDYGLWSIIQEIVTPKVLEKLDRDQVLGQLKELDEFKRPLFVFFSAVALNEQGSIKGWSKTKMLDYHLERQEKKIWAENRLWKDSAENIQNLIWLATICEEFYEEDIYEVIKECPYLFDFKDLRRDRFKKEDIRELEKLFGQIALQKQLTKKEQHLNKKVFYGIKPDLLAEYYIVKQLEELKINGRPQVIHDLLMAAWNIRPERVWWMVYLCFRDYTSISGMEAIIKWIEENETKIPDKAKANLGGLFFGFGNVLSFDGNGNLKLNANVVNSEKYYKKAIEHGYVGAINNLANLYQEEGKKEEAEKYYKKAIEHGDVSAINNLAYLYEKEGRKEEAEKYYKKAIEHGDVGAMYNLANLYKKEGGKEDAEKYYLKAIEHGDVDAVYNLANLYKEEGRKEDAEKYYKKAIEHGYVDAINNLAILCQEEGRKEDAEKFYLKAIEHGDVDAVYNLANLYKKEGVKEDAEKYYKKAIDHGHVGAMYNLGLFYYRDNVKKNDVVSLLERAIKSSPNDLNSLLIYVIVLVWANISEKYLEIRDDVLSSLIKNAPDKLFLWLLELIVHDKKSYPLECFETGIHKVWLQENLKVVHYVALYFYRPNDPALENIPEEMRDDFKEKVANVEERRKFYCVEGYNKV